MGDLSAHFSKWEFRGPVDIRLVLTLERLRRDRGGLPLRIVSGYRDADHNRRVGGAVRSQHLYGRAADIPYGYATEYHARRAGFKGVGTQNGYAVHVDVRDGPYVTWRY